MDEIVKKPYEKFPIYFDFSTDLDSGESISFISATCINTSTLADTAPNIISAPTLDLTKPIVQVVIQNGVAGEVHKVTVRATTNFNSIYEKDVFVAIAEGSEGFFIKQSGEKFTVTYDFTNDLETGDLITLATVSAVLVADGSGATGTVIDGSLVASPKVNVGVKAGASGSTYKITIQATTQAGYKYQGDLTMVVRDI